MRSIIMLAAGVFLATSSEKCIAQSSPDRPNVVLIMTDDAGYADTGSYGAPDIRTPNIDSLAKSGVKLTHFYANGMSCTPTRAGLIAGRYQQRYGIEFVLPAPGISGSERGLTPMAHSLPLLLKKNGYATALVGKWHLGYRPEFSPLAHGFDLFFGYKSAAIDYHTHFTTRPSEGAQFGSAQPDLWGKRLALCKRGLYDGPHHKQKHRVHSTECEAALLHRCSLQCATQPHAAARKACK